jgi:hypothetical protein
MKTKFLIWYREKFSKSRREDIAAISSFLFLISLLVNIGLCCAIISARTNISVDLLGEVDNKYCTVLLNTDRVYELFFAIPTYPARKLGCILSDPYRGK